MIKSFKGKSPNIEKTCYISESADIIGNVNIDCDSSIWFGARLRGDMSNIFIGKRTNIQENSVVHGDENYSVKISNDVTIGHGAIIHGCEIEENVLIGMGSVILNGAKIGKNSIVGAKSLVTGNKIFEEGVLILGNPAKAVRKLTKEEIESIKISAIHYLELSREYM